MLGLSHVDAPEVITSREIEMQLSKTVERLGMPMGLLEHVAGIQERRWWPNGTMPSDAATTAAERLFEQVDVPRERVGVIVNTSVCGIILSRQLPLLCITSWGCQVHARISTWVMLAWHSSMPWILWVA